MGLHDRLGSVLCAKVHYRPDQKQVRVDRMPGCSNPDVNAQMLGDKKGNGRVSCRTYTFKTTRDKITPTPEFIGKIRL